MNVLLLLGGLITLLVSGDLLVRGGVTIAGKFKLSRLVIGMTLVSFGTSSPELVVSLQSVIAGASDISTGTVIGSNLSNIGFILGLTILIRPMNVNRTSVTIDAPLVLASTLLLYLFFLDGKLGRIEGIIMVIILLVYVVYSIIKSRKSGENHSENDTAVAKMPLWVALLMVALSILGLRYGAEWLVTGATHLARDVGISELAISISIVAVGTSLPELSTSLMAAIRKENDISIGNILGSNLFNILGILGVTAIVKPLPVNSQILSSDMFWMGGITLLLFLFMLPARSGRLVRAEGFILLITYAVYLTMVLTR